MHVDSKSIFVEQQTKSNIHSTLLQQSSEESHTTRDLVWIETLENCDDTTFASFARTYPDIRSCFIYGVQWDAEGTIKATGYNVFFKDGEFFDTLTVWVASYNGNSCDKFDSCVFGTRRFPGLYAYDCSNVYCGPNAARTCAGEYTASSTCPSGETEASLPDIPFLRDVDCQRFLINNIQYNGLEDYCSSCEYNADVDVNVVTCALGCQDCSENGDCVTQEDSFYFSETRFVQEITWTTTLGSSLSVLKRGPPQVDGFASPSVFNCLAYLNGSECSCTICGNRNDSTVTKTLDLFVTVDCTDVDGVTFGSDCIDKDMWTGVYETIASVNECSKDQAPVAAPANTPIVSPTIDNAPAASSPNDGVVSPTDMSAAFSAAANVFASFSIFAIVALFNC